MPAPRAALHDIEKLKLSHDKPHKNLGAHGRLRVVQVALTKSTDEIHEKNDVVEVQTEIKNDGCDRTIIIENLVEELHESEMSTKKSDDFFKSRKSQKKSKVNSL